MAAVDALAAAWQHHFPCFVSQSRAFATQRPVEAELFTALGIARRLWCVPEAHGLVTAIVAAIADRIAGADRVHFFLDRARLPADANCTAVAYLLLLDAGRASERDAHRALDQIAANTDASGVAATYFDPNGAREGIIGA